MIRFLTAGESHGKALVGIIEGLPAGLEIEVGYINAQMKRRKLGYGRGARQKMEDDSVEVLSGVRHGATLGSPIALLVENKDWKNWADIMGSEPHSGGEVRRQIDVPRPGHADLVGGIKYGHADMRNVLERSSARETTMRVALATVVRKFLEEFGIHIASRVVRIGPHADATELTIPVEKLNEKVDPSPVRCLDPRVEAEMIKEIEACKKAGDTLGGVFEVYASHLPVGLGSHSQWDRRLEGQIAQQLMSLNAIKGVEVGMGFQAAANRGSEVHDEYAPSGKKFHGRYGVQYTSNHSGGIDGGMTTGQILVVRSAMKPLATLMEALQSVNLKTGEPMPAHVERSDVCAVPAAAVVGESLVAFALANALMEKFGGDSIQELKPRVQAWKE